MSGTSRDPPEVQGYVFIMNMQDKVKVIDGIQIQWYLR